MWDKIVKPREEAEKCSDCVNLLDDNGTLRCKLFYNAIVENTHEKHCEDSVDH